MNMQASLSTPFLAALAFSFLLSACGGSSSSFDEQDLEPVTINPIETGGGVDGGEDGGEEGGSDGGSNGQVTVGGSLSEEELAELPQIEIPLRQFSTFVVTFEIFVAEDGLVRVRPFEELI